MSSLRIGTRGSRLALWQADELARLLRGLGFTPEIVTVRTTGDRRGEVPLSSIGGKGLFIKELEEALEAGTIDLAVHSLKDVPSIVPATFELAAFLERGDPRDAWLGPDRLPIERLPAGSVIGTSSPRRRAQILARWPHLRVSEIRGNVETRIEKQRSGRYDGIVLAAAGLARLGRSAEASRLFDLDEIVPAAGQGTIAVEILREHDSLRRAIRPLSHAPSETAALAERAVLQKFGTRLDCHSPIAVHCDRSTGSVVIRAFLSDLEGRDPIRLHERGSDCEELARRTAAILMDRGGLELLARASGD
ncbi:MAG TPA: hydroxymethylbilane synthase [Thermoanaerobaculia bacterium]|nr:hydroxymethylbilane synthase [Thermoanaerobaculia bacterium]